MLKDFDQEINFNRFSWNGKNKYWFKTIPNDKEGNILRLKLSRLKLHRLSRSSGFENLNYSYALLNYNNGLRLGWEVVKVGGQGKINYSF